MKMRNQKKKKKINLKHLNKILNNLKKYCKQL